jgi:hypothetical protein
MGKRLRAIKRSVEIMDKEGDVPLAVIKIGQQSKSCIQ